MSDSDTTVTTQPTDTSVDPVATGADTAAVRARPQARTHPSRTERAAAGKAARNRVSLDAHADVTVDGRPDPLALLESQAGSRVPELVPIRYGRMVATPFSFYRGAALIMAADLARQPHSGLMVQLCGDAHLSNFGVFATPERHLAFDVNDFDETHPGPFEWDVKRLAASMAVAGRENGYSTKKRRAIVLATVAAYREMMTVFAGQGNLAVWYAHLDMDDVMRKIGDQLDRKQKKRTQAALDKARGRDSLQALRKLTTKVDGRARLLSQPPLLVPFEELWGQGQAEQGLEALRMSIKSYRRTLAWHRRLLLDQFHLVQAARKVVGVGSVGTRAWILLFEGADGGDPLFLQAKEAQPSVLSGFLKSAGFKNQGQRVVTGQRSMQAASDIFLGWHRQLGPDAVERDYYLRQLRDGKGSAVVEEMQASGMIGYGRLCSAVLARAHARSGDRVAIAAYLGSKSRFDQAIADFAESYADVNESDQASLADAIATGRVTAEVGV